LKDTVLTISPDYSDRPTPDFLALSIKQLKSLLIRAADALENGPSETHFQLVPELRKAAQ
jgi:hypothetical protein